MKPQTLLFTACLTTALFSVSCNNNEKPKEEEKTVTAPKIKEENITYTADTVTCNGFVAYDENQTAKRPVVLVVHEWWGLVDYPKMRARQLAEMGYVAMAVDIYGNGKTAETPQDAQALATPFYQNPQLALSRLNAAIAKAKTLPNADTTQMAGIGYCFGGGLLLNAVRLGAELDGVASFHGSLMGTPANKDLLKAKILVCHGEADSFVPASEVAAFKKSMDSIGADYTLKTYANATHAFTNPEATEKAKKFNMPITYNGAADTASWNDMKDFFGKIFK